jgi:hypothetical protein
MDLKQFIEKYMTEYSLTKPYEFIEKYVIAQARKIAADTMVCQFEGWNHLEYIEQIEKVLKECKG